MGTLSFQNSHLVLVHAYLHKQCKLGKCASLQHVH